MREYIESMDLSALSESGQTKIRSMLLKDETVLAVSDLDLGCTDFVTRYPLT